MTNEQLERFCRIVAERFVRAQDVWNERYGSQTRRVGLMRYGRPDRPHFVVRDHLAEHDQGLASVVLFRSDDEGAAVTAYKTESMRPFLEDGIRAVVADVESVIPTSEAFAAGVSHALRFVRTHVDLAQKTQQVAIKVRADADTPHLGHAESMISTSDLAAILRRLEPETNPTKADNDCRRDCEKCTACASSGNQSSSFATASRGPS